MKKKIFGGLSVLVIAVVAAFNVNLSLDYSDSNLSSLALANLEALAQESGGGTNPESGLDTKYIRSTSDCSISASAALALDFKVKGNADLVMSNAEVVCSGGGNTACSPANCASVWSGL